MATRKKKNRLTSKPLTLAVTPEMLEDLEALVVNARGRYGKTRTEAAERLLAERLQDIVDRGVLLPHPRLSRSKRSQ